MKICLLAVFVLGALAFVPQIANAKDGDSDVASSDTGRVLAGHHFAPSDLVRQPFITTSFAAYTGLGTLELSGIPVTDDTGTPTGETFAINLALLQQGFDMNFALNDWLGIATMFAGGVNTGTDSDGALQYGALANYSYGIGALASLLKTSSAQLSGALGVSRGSAMQLSPLQAMVTALETGKISTSGLFTKRTETTLVASGQFAYAFSEIVGTWASVSYSRTSTDVAGESSSSSDLEGGAALSVDFDPWVDFPVGVLVSYLYGKGLEDGAKPYHYAGGGLFYTGRKHLALGAEVYLFKTSYGGGMEVNATSGQLRVQYFW